MTSHSLGIDIGGTFTDVVLVDGAGAMFTSKVLTTPDDLTRGCLQGLEAVLAKAGVDGSTVGRVVHATTQATNVLLERRQAPVPLLITEGFKDLLDICAGGRYDLYDLMWEPWRPPTNGSHTFEVPERMGAKGQVFKELDEERVRAIAATLAAQNPTAVAVCFLHSYAFPEHEQRVGAILREALGDCYIALSSAVWPEHREYQRAVATVLSAYIGPVMASYLQQLESNLRQRGVKSALHVMQSNGGAMSVAGTVARPLQSIESGPAAGALAAGHVGSLSGFDRVIGFDMGGTTAKASLIEDGRPRTRSTMNIGGHTTGGYDGVLLQLPVLDLVEVGAGGGSIARVDSGGALQVGPKSAGAAPGPACYGRGGEEPTVTDCNLLLGYLAAGSFLGGSMKLHPELAEKAMAPVADALGCTVVEAAAAVHDLVNLGMEDAIRLVTIARGLDPRDYSVMAFGGAGPTHVARLAEAFGINRVIVPRVPGLFSTVGLLASDVTYEETKSLWLDFESATAESLNAHYETLESEAVAELRLSGFDPSMIVIERSADVRRARQVHDMSVPVAGGRLSSPDVAAIASRYHDQYEQAYGLRREGPLVLQSLKIKVKGQATHLRVEPAAALPQPSPIAIRSVYFREVGGFAETPVYDRSTLGRDVRLEGPALIEETESTTVVPPSWTVRLDDSANLVIERR